MVLLMPLNAAVGKRLKDLQTKQMKLKDKRIKISSEIVSGIKVRQRERERERERDSLKLSKFLG